MNAIEFESTITPGGEIAIPREIAAEIPAGEPLRVVVMWQAASDDLAWRSAAREKFESAYGPEDAVYEELADDAPPR